jgi:hypothetical protein
MFARSPKHGKEAAAAVLLVAALSFGGAGSASAAASCPTNQGAKAQVAALVAQLHEAVPSHSARAAIKRALVQSRQAMRGKEAQTKSERVNLGQQISALAKTLHTATTLVERKAIIASIHALQAEKKAGKLTKAERAQIKADNKALKKAVVAKLDTSAEIKAITAQFRLIHKSFTCTG